jgi:hypothetical protein
MDIEEISNQQIEITEDGKIITQIKSQNQKEMDKLTREIKLNTETDYFSTTSSDPERNFYKKYRVIIDTLRQKDQERCERVGIALEKGEYIDDPIFVELLLSNERFIKLREKFLKKYYQEGKLMSKFKMTKKEISDLKSKQWPLLDKYAKDDPANAVYLMDREDMFYKYDHKEGKMLTDLYYELEEEIQKEENVGDDFVDDKLFACDDEEIESEAEAIFSMREIIKDGLNEINSNKNKYITGTSGDFEIEKSENEKSAAVTTTEKEKANYQPGRRSKNKKMMNLF